MPGRRDRKRRQTLNLIASVAATLFEANGFDAVTMEQIAAAADVAKGTLYNHFPTKEAVLAHWIHTELADDLPRLLGEVDLQSGFASVLTHILHASADWCEQHRTYLAPYLRYRMLALGKPPTDVSSTDTQDMTGAFAELILKSQEAGEIRTDMSATHLATLFHHLYLGAVLRWMTVPRLNLREEFVSALRLFAEGARSGIRSGSEQDSSQRGKP